MCHFRVNDVKKSKMPVKMAPPPFKRGANSILLNIHEVWPRPFWGGSSHQKENTVYHLIGHIPFASLEGDKRPDKINQKSGEFEHFMP